MDLFELIDMDNYDELKTSLENGADLNIQDCIGQTLLEAACQELSLKCVKLLLDFGIDPNRRSAYGYTPLHTKCKYHSQFLMNDEGVKINKNIECIKLLLAAGANPDAVNDRGETPLRIVCEYFNMEAVKVLLGVNADVNKTNYEGYLPLHVATRYKTGLDYMKLLLETGSKIDVVNSKGETPLQMACRYRNIEAIKLLLDHGVDINTIKDEAILSELNLRPFCNIKRSK